MRDLIATGDSTYRKRPQRVRWSGTAVRERVPISICAEGPKMLHLAGRIGDGVIAGTGLLPEVIADTIAKVEAGVHAAGRDPGAVDTWFTTRTSSHEDRDRAIENVKASVSSILNHSMRYSLAGKCVPPDLSAKIQTYVDGYVLYDHVVKAGRNPQRMDELGLTDYALQRLRLPEMQATGYRELSKSHKRGQLNCGSAPAAGGSSVSCTTCGSWEKRSWRISSS